MTRIGGAVGELVGAHVCTIIGWLVRFDSVIDCSP